MMGSVMVEEIHGEYEPWFTPVLERFSWKKKSRERWSPCCFVYRPDRRGNHRFLHGSSRRGGRSGRMIIIDKLSYSSGLADVSPEESHICGSDPVGLCGQPVC